MTTCLRKNYNFMCKEEVLIYLLDVMGIFFFFDQVWHSIVVMPLFLFVFICFWMGTECNRTTRPCCFRLMAPANR